MGNDKETVLLDYLYGLLDEAEAAQIRDRLSSDPDWQAALVEAEKMKRSFARAAHLQKPVPEFKVPDDAGSAPAQPTGPATLPLPAAPQKPFVRFFSYAAAACLFLGGAGLFIYYQNGLADHAMRVQLAENKLGDVDKQLAKLNATANEAKSKLAETVNKRFVHVSAMGPAQPTAQAPTPLRVRTTDINGKPLPARLTAMLLADNREIGRSEVLSGGQAVVQLPPVDTTGPMTLLVRADTDGGTAQAKEAIEVRPAETVTHIALSKPGYGTGEILFFRTLTLDRFTMKPRENEALIFSLVDGTGRTVCLVHGKSGPGGIGGGEFALTPDLAGGSYTLRATRAGGEVVAARPLEIAPGDTAHLRLDRGSYRPGETITVRIQAKPAAKGKVAISINGKRVSDGEAFAVDENGRATVRLSLSGKAQGKGTIDTEVEALGKKSLVRQPFAIADSRLDVELWPEGGKLVTGIPNRVYYRIRTSLGEPAFPDGRLELLAGTKVIFKFEQAIGWFPVTPRDDETYSLRDTSPDGSAEMANPFKQLVVTPEGIAVRALNSVAREGEAVELVLHNQGPERRVLFVATCRGQVVAEEFVDLRAGENSLRLPIAGRGLLRLTLYAPEKGNLERLAERLVYRVPEQWLELAVAQDKKSYSPGERVNLALSMKDEMGNPAHGWSTAAVIDENEAGPAQSRAWLDLYFYLFSELGMPSDAEFDFNDESKSLDAFLGTRGWRATPAADNGTVIVRADTKPAPLVFIIENANRRQLAAALMVQTVRELDKRIGDERSNLESDRARSARDYEVAAAALGDFRELPARTMGLLNGLLTLASLAAGALFLAFGLVRVITRHSAGYAFVGACACLFVCIGLFALAGHLPQAGEPTAIRAPAANEWIAGETLPALNVAGIDLPTGVLAALPSRSTNVVSSHGPDVLAQGVGAGKVQVANLRERFLQAVKFQNDRGLKGGNSKASTSANQKNPPKTERQMSVPTDYEHRRSAAGEDLQDIVLWKPALAVPQGEARASFDLSQRTSNYRIVIYGNDSSGRLGYHHETLIVAPIGR